MESEEENIKQRSRLPCNYYYIKETDRDSIIEEFIKRIPAIVHGMNLNAEGQTSDDFLSEAYVALVEAVDSYLNEDIDHYGVTLEQWVVRRIRCRLVDKQRYYSARKRSIGKSYVPIDDDVIINLTGDNGIPVNDIVTKAVIDELPEVEKIIIKKFYYSGLSEREIGNILGWTTHKVHYRKSKILSKLKALMFLR